MLRLSKFPCQSRVVNDIKSIFLSENKLDSLTRRYPDAWSLGNPEIIVDWSIRNGLSLQRIFYFKKYYKI